MTKETEKVDPQIKIKEIENDVKKQATLALKFKTLTTIEEVGKATEFLAGVKARIKKIEELRTTFVKPLNDHVKTINNMFKSQSTPLEEMETQVKRAISNFHVEEDRKAKAEEARLQKIRDNANEKREEKGQEQIVAPIKTVERVEQTVKTEVGSSTAKKVIKFRVVDINKVPREYLRCEVNTMAVNGAIKQGVAQIEGLEFYEDFEVSARIG